MDKQKLAGDILSSNGEQWITKLNNEELMKNMLKNADKKSVRRIAEKDVFDLFGI